VGIVSELVAEHAKGPRSVSEGLRGLVGGAVLDEVGPEGFVLALGRVLGFEEEAGFRALRYSYFAIASHIWMMSYSKLNRNTFGNVL
jgi:hypothetical protein